jgi:hypothetical protein
MRKSVFNLSVLALFAFFLTVLQCPAQQATQNRSQLFPILDGNKRDGLPQQLHVQGTVSRVDYAPPHCGELIFPTTLEIKPDAKLSGYKYQFVYLVVPCLYKTEGAENLLNKRIEITATKQDADARRCFFDIKTSRIDSRGVPFYCVGREEFLKAVMPDTVSSSGEPSEFTGTLGQGKTYRALVTREEEQEWRTVIPLMLPHHHAGRVEWLNLKDFPALNKPQPGSLLKQIVFTVMKKEIAGFPDQNRWNTTYYCRIIAVE